MSKPPPRGAIYLIKGGLTEQRAGIYRLRERQPGASAAETWPRDGEWRRLVHSLMRSLSKKE